MTSLFVRKMECFVDLPPDDQRALEAVGQGAHVLGPHKRVIGKDEDPDVVVVLLQGWACICQMLADGRRQIISLLLPGDVFDPHLFASAGMNRLCVTLTSATLVKVPGLTLRSMADRSPSFADAMRQERLSNIGTQSEWMVSIGRRTATERLAHLCCEVMTRLQAVGLTSGSECDFPLTQVDLADATGLSAMHLHRTIQELRSRKWVDVRSKRLTIRDRDRLEQLAMFDAGYLRLRPKSVSASQVS